MQTHQKVPALMASGPFPPLDSTAGVDQGHRSQLRNRMNVSGPESTATMRISQKDNLAGRHGLVFRSSAIFYFRQAPGFRTSIAFMDYWQVKRGLEVAVVASVRRMEGELVRREVLAFPPGGVLVYRPFPPHEDFEGSVEIEIFAARNLVIPYAAIMAVYETHRSISMVHSYSRTYAPHEIEEQRTITVGRESCWTVRDTDDIRSFCVMHNGSALRAPQTIHAQLRNHRGDVRRIEYRLETLAPYATVRLQTATLCPEVAAFLEGQPGNVALAFELEHAFTRLLVGNETADEIQVTHSNFNYASHQSDTVESSQVAFMHVVHRAFAHSRVVLYPDCEPGKYEVRIGNRVEPFTGERRIELPVSPGELLQFRRLDGALPTRIVTAFSAATHGDHILPFECSLGVQHAEMPPKRSHWGLIAATSELRTELIVQLPHGHAGHASEPVHATLSLYSATSRPPRHRILDADTLRALDQGLGIDALFDDLEDDLGGSFGYFYLTAELEGVRCYSVISNTAGGTTFEHAF